jgi:hypothetical protein
MKVSFTHQLFYIKGPMVFVLFTLRSLFYLKAYCPWNLIYLLYFLSYGNINLTPSIIFLLGFSAICHFTQFTLKDLCFIGITNIPQVFCATHMYHSKPTYITLKPSVYVSNYLNVTACVITIIRVGQKDGPRRRWASRLVIVGLRIGPYAGV